MCNDMATVQDKRNGNINSRSEIIREFITSLGTVDFDNDAMFELVHALIKEYPQNDILTQVSDLLESDLVLERNESELPWIIFSLNNTAYGINSKHVLSIELLGDITAIVDAPHYCPGIVRSRGEMIELVDLRALFGSGDYQSAKSNKDDAVFMMIVTEMNTVKRGLIVDEIIAVEHITRFDEGIVNNKESSITSQYVHLIARREKSDAPVLIIMPENLKL